MTADRRAGADDVTAVLEALPLDDRELSSERAEVGRRGREALLADPAGAVPLLLDRLAEPSFAVKDTVYDLVIALGEAARGPLEAEWGRRGPVTDIWLAGTLVHLGAAEAMRRVRPLLDAEDGYARHLAALALAFQQFELTPPSREDPLWGVLVEALDDDRQLEGSPFTVAGSALAALTRLSGEAFLSPPRDIQLYNYEHFVYPPPTHPFPLAADHLTKAPAAEQAAIRSRVERWLKHRRPA